MKRRAGLSALVLLGLPAITAAQTASGEFTVGDIRVEGLQRLTEGTVFNYLPVNIGDRLNPQRLREALRALYATGFFRDVELRRDGNTLVVAVLERPSLESVELKGNKDIKTEDLQKSLRQVGLSAGKTFNRSTLEEVTQYLTDQYYSRGKYAVSIDTKVEDLPNNRVRVTIDIKEGGRAKIRQINIVGNTRFKAKDILETLSLKTPSWTSWYKQNDRYSRESLQGDLEKIKTWYQDRGYANFRADSVQVAISPEKSDIFITVNITEGEVYKIGAVKLAGNLVVPEAELQKLLLVAPGQTYSQKIISATQELIKNRLGAEGFYFARVEPVPESHEQNRTVDLTLFVDPGNRVYVRQISFSGTTRSNDETLRREMRQLEGALLSNVAVERSKQRLQRQSFIEDVEVDTEAVPGSPDLVDVTFKVKERPSAQIGGGIGYSASQKFMLNGNFSDSNFMGTGNAVSLQIDSGRYNRIYSFVHTNPYVSVDGLSRSVSLSYRDSTQFVSESSDFRSRNMGVGLSYGYPITEYQRVNAGLSLQAIDLLTYGGASAQQAVDWVQQNGGPYARKVLQTVTLPDGTSYTMLTTLYGSEYKTLELSLGWMYDSRNRGLFADRGQRHTLGVVVAAPGSKARYAITNYDYTGYLPLWRRWTLSFGVQLAYGRELGGTTALPPYKRFYAGGPDTVRGYVESTLGPRDSNGNPYGGNLLAAAQTELIVPLPQKWQTSARASLFFDIGNTFSTDGAKYLGRDLQTPVDYKFKYSELKQSAGIALEWLAPSLGIFRFSYGVPLNKFSGDGVHFADRTESFQFTVGQSF
ncbi:MAG: outer membrane protein assembly factor BamA [Gammaproteobacteria bacterium]|nr:outer membrane protein assembly factor BamA [Gammaproteobacteria bacterium]